MNRRGFLGMLAAGLAAAVDPEKSLWVPGRKLISIPKPPEITPDTPWIVLQHTMTREEFRKRYPSPMTAQFLIENAIRQINRIGPPPVDQRASFDEFNALLDRWSVEAFSFNRPGARA